MRRATSRDEHGIIAISAVRAAAAVAIAALLATPAEAVAQEATPAGDEAPVARRAAPVDWLAPCDPANESPQAPWCGTYEVWEDREAGSGRRIGLNVMVLPALSAAPEPDPVFWLHGGPGGAATESAAGVAQALAESRKTRDLVFVDQRGTGESHPLDCPIPGEDEPLQEHFEEFLPLDEVRACLEMQDADVRLYTTPIAMDDLNEVRQALGYDQINLLGGSYGTRAGLIYLRRHPETVRAAVLKGVAPTNMRNPLPFARALDRGIQAVIAACEAEEACAAAYPDLADDWARVVARFEQGPVTAEVERGGRRETVTISRGVFADGIRHILYSVFDSRRLPGIIHDAARGDFDRFAQRELAQAIDFGNMLSMGMFLSVTCSEDLRFITEEDIRRETDGTFLGDYRIRRQLAACEAWERGEIDEGYEAPVTADVPVLLISGEVDTATPYEGANWVAEFMPRAVHLIVPNESHAFANAACEFGVMNRFIAHAGPADLRPECLQETKRPPFETGSS